MKEFDKIYIAKYYDAIEKWQIQRDFNINEKELENIVKDLKQTGIYDIYKKLSDDEWETLEKIRFVYFKKVLSANTWILSEDI